MSTTSYTAYLPEPNLFTKKPGQDSSLRSLDNYSRRLDKQNRKLDDLNEVCLSNLDKCKNFCNIASNLYFFVFILKFILNTY